MLICKHPLAAGQQRLKPVIWVTNTKTAAINSSSQISNIRWAPKQGFFTSWCWTTISLNSLIEEKEGPSEFCGNFQCEMDHRS